MLGTAVAIALSTTAVAMVGDRVTDRQVPRVSESAVEAALAEDPPADPSSSVPADDAETGTAAEPAGAEPAVAPDGRSGGSSSTDDTGSAATGEGSGAPGGAGGSSGDDDGLRGDGTVDDGGSSGGGSGASSGGDSSGPGSGPTTTTSARPVAATYVTPGGTVAVECRGTTIGLLYATPASGYAIDGTPKTGPSEVEVRFRPLSGSGGQEERVRARCQDGRPVPA